MSIQIKNKQILVTTTFNLQNQRISNLAQPTNSDDATSLSYLQSNYFDLSGGTINGDVTVNGDFYVSGTTVTIDVDNMNIFDNILLINSGETSAGVSLINSGIEVDRGTLDNYQFIFNETSKDFKIGEIGSLQSVATREDNPIHNRIAFWNTGTTRFETSNDLKFDGTNLYISSMTQGNTDKAVYYSSTTGKLLYNTFTSGTVSNVSSSTTNQLTVANQSTTPALSIVTNSVVNNGTALATGDQIYDFVTGLGYQTIVNLYEYTGITSNQSLDYLPSGQTLGMVYITNNGTTDASINLGTTTTGNEITPYTTIDIASGQTISVTINMRLSSAEDKTLYISSSSWTNVDLDLEWAPITYQNGDIGGGGGGITSVSNGGTGVSTVGTDQLLTGNGGNALTSEPNLTFDGSKLTINGELQVNTMESGTTSNTVYYDTTTSGFTYGSGGSGGSGGFLGVVTKDTAEPSNLTNNQWVSPAPQSNGTFSYTFDNFLNSSSVGITVNLSLENIYLRYDSDGGYWIKESFDKPLSSGKTWVGTTNNIVTEIEVIEEWVDTSGITDIGQKYDNQVQTLMKSSSIKTTYIQNFSVTKDIDLTTIANTLLINSESGKKLLIKSIKMIILNTADPDSFTINIGTNSAQNYNNIINGLSISDVIVDEYYDLTLIKIPTGSDGSIISISSTPLYLRVTSTPTASTLDCHIIIEGFIY